MTDAHETVVGCVIGNREESRLSAAKFSLAPDITRSDADAIEVVDLRADGEHAIGAGVGSGRLHQLHKRVIVVEVIRVDGAHPAITGAADILEQRSDLETLRGFSYRHIRVGEATK